MTTKPKAFSKTPAEVLEGEGCYTLLPLDLPSFQRQKAINQCQSVTKHGSISGLIITAL